MPKDHGEHPRVAWDFAVVVPAGRAAIARLAARATCFMLAACAALGGCGPSVRPDKPFPEETAVARDVRPPPAPAQRHVLVGELCPQGAAGRPAVAPLLMRTTQWIDVTAEVTGAVERGAVPRFVAFGTDGKTAGMFETVGLADITLGQSVAAGAYMGSSPCSGSDSGSAGTGPGQRIDDAACARATRGCGLAVAALTRPDDPPAAPAYTTGGACVSGDALAVDTDGDGAVEWFPLSGVLDGIRSPAQEWSANQTPRQACKPAFVQYDIKLAAEPDRGKPADPRATVVLDVLGVIDLDADGRIELVIALRFPTVRTVVVYSAASSPGRLDLVGEAQSFQ